MVRIPGSNDEWEQHVHTSGRIFLSNLRTFETRWLWTKWDINGRLFVRNTIDPNKRVWFDEMDVSMRIQSGNATAQEVEYYQNGLQQNLSTHPQIATQQPTTTTATAPLTANPAATSIAAMTATAAMATGTGAITTYIQPTPIPLKPIHLHHAHAKTQEHDMMSSRKRHHHSFYNNNHNATNHKPNNLAYGLRIEPKRPRYTPNNGANIYSHHHNQAHTPYSHHMSGTLPPGSMTTSASVTGNPSNASSINRPPANYVPTPPLPAGHKLCRCATRLRGRSSGLREHVADEHRTKYLGTNCMIRDASQNTGMALMDDDGYDVAGEPVIGTSEMLEKEYLRLTSAPKPEMVRPPRVLCDALTHIERLWNFKQRDYDWTCRQLKAIRQDYKVQAIHDEHVIRTYETHARLALQNNDLGEFNTCVAQVRELYRRSRNKARQQQQQQQQESEQPQSKDQNQNQDQNQQNDQQQEYHQHENEDEFTAYHILYNVITNAKSWTQLNTIAEFMQNSRRISTKSTIDNNSSPPSSLPSSQPKTQHSWPLTQFTLNVRAAFVAVNYSTYSKLRNSPPRRKNTFLSFLLKRLDERVQYQSLRCMITAYSPGLPALLPVSFVLRQSCCQITTSDDHSHDDNDNDNQHDEQQQEHDNIVDVDSFLVNGDKSEFEHEAQRQEAVQIAEQLKRIGLKRAPESVLRGAIALVKFNVVLYVDRKASSTTPGSSSASTSTASNSVAAVFVDCKATKGAGGVRKPESTGDLITHAGSAFHHR